MSMTTSLSAKSALRAARQFVLGPWPLHNGALWAFLSTMIVAVMWRLFGAQPLIVQETPLSFRVVQIGVVGIVGPAVAIAPLILYRRLRPRFTSRPVTSVEYLLSLLSASLIAAVILKGTLPLFPLSKEVFDQPRLGGTIARTFFLLWFLNATLGAIFARIQVESDTAKAALKTVVAQRRLLLESEERVRGQVAAYLHDRVQTDLVSIGLRIRAAVASGSELLVSDVDDALADLERVRAEEIRGASRQLSPNLEHVNLDAALRDLAKAYRPAMVISIHVSDAAARELARQDQTNRSIGLYRICEQGLLNAAAHGHATECSVRISISAGNDLELEVRDNGVGLPAGAITPGMGSTVISAWVEALGGEWSLTPVNVGVVLSASFPSA